MVNIYVNLLWKLTIWWTISSQNIDNTVNMETIWRTIILIYRDNIVTENAKASDVYN